MSRPRVVACYAIIASILVLPVVMAAMSPLLEWRGPMYIVACFAGVIALSIMPLQPLLAGGLLPQLTTTEARRVHRWTGSVLVACIVIHVVGLWITSPPDVIDALLFASATPFSHWGVIAMWSALVSVCLVVLRRKFRIRALIWRNSHLILALVTVAGSVAHALLIEGTMEALSKTALCLLLVIATARVLVPTLFKR